MVIGEWNISVISFVVVRASVLNEITKWVFYLLYHSGLCDVFANRVTRDLNAPMRAQKHAGGRDNHSGKPFCLKRLNNGQLSVLCMRICGLTSRNGKKYVYLLKQNILIFQVLNSFVVEYNKRFRTCFANNLVR